MGLCQQVPYSTLSAKPPLRRGFACGKTLVRSTRAAGQKAGGVQFCLLVRNFKISKLSGYDKKKDMTEGHVFLFGFRRPGRLHPSALECSGRRSRPSAEVLPAAKRSNAAKAARPRRAVGQDLRQLIQNFKYLDCSDLPKQRDIRKDVLLFWVPPPEGDSTPRNFNTQGGEAALLYSLCTKETPAIDRRLFMFLEQAPLERLGTEKQGCSATI